ncbi:hypothetical protein DPMN_036804 [Dreissena polymorpha]|uniref:Uncharacterized protein n=1 Tax=Dreissena polymorpha TaxID=45954 RepID=A0A9D4ME70_DREPO|nr:hypothetical protein DPMN_036804 [Dreissena polymorpha]
MAPDTKVPDGRTDRQPDGQRQNNIPPPLANVLLDTKCRPDGQPDGRTDNAKTISLRQGGDPLRGYVQSYSWNGGTNANTFNHIDSPNIIINVASRVVTRKTAPSQSDIIRTNVLSKFHDNWTKK